MIQQTSCCGVKEINGLSDDPLDNVIDVLRFRLLYKFPIILFTDNFIDDDDDVGQDLADFIVDKKLGELVETSKVLNPNSGNEIKAWLWVVDFDAVEKLVNKPLSTISSNSLSW